MQARRLVAAALLGLATLAIAFWATRPTSGLQLHFLKADRDNQQTKVTFEVRNMPRHFNSVLPVALDMQRGGYVWRRWPEEIVSRSETNHAGALVLNCSFRAQPEGTHLRVVVNTVRELRGLETFLTRLQMRLTGDRAPLNPFDKTPLYDLTGETSSEEFVQP